MMNFTKGTIVDKAIGTVICPICYEVMTRAYWNSNSKKPQCFKCGCLNTPVIVDELIAYTIVELNKKGYKTRTCCSGHLYGDAGYIAFTEDNLLNSINEFANGKVVFYNHNSICDDNNVIRWSTKPYNGNYIKSLNDIVRINKLLYKWAKSLPLKINTEE